MGWQGHGVGRDQKKKKKDVKRLFTGVAGGYCGGDVVDGVVSQTESELCRGVADHDIWSYLTSWFDY